MAKRSQKDAAYARLEARIKKGKLAALLARWLFGKTLLKERGGRLRLPKGRAEHIANALAISDAELRNRMQFAEQCRSRADVITAFKKHGSWYAICQHGLGRRRNEVHLGEPATMKRDLVEWGALDSNDLEGLTPQAEIALVLEARKLYEFYCWDDDREKVADRSGTDPAGIRLIVHRVAEAVRAGSIEDVLTLRRRLRGWFATTMRSKHHGRGRTLPKGWRELDRFETLELGLTKCLQRVRDMLDGELPYVTLLDTEPGQPKVNWRDKLHWVSTFRPLVTELLDSLGQLRGELDSAWDQRPGNELPGEPMLALDNGPDRSLVYSEAS